MKRDNKLVWVIAALAISAVIGFLVGRSIQVFSNGYMQETAGMMQANG